MANISAPTYSSRKFLQRSAVAASIRMLGLVCVFALQVLLARLIGDSEEYGKYAWGQSLLFMAGSLACLGLPVVTARFIASLAIQGNEAAIQGIIHTATRLMLRSSGLLVLSALLLNVFWHDSSTGHLYRNSAVLALLLAPAITFANLYQALCRARQWLALALLPLNVLRPLATGALVLCCWQLYDTRLDGEVVLGIAGISVLVILLPQTWLYHRRAQRLIDLAAPVPDSDYHPSRLFHTALPVFAVRCATLTMNYSNVLLVGFLAGPAAAGAYFAAERLAQLAAIPESVVSSVNQQSMAEAHATANSTALQKITTQSAHGSLWPTLLIGLALTVLATPLLQLFGEDFSSARFVLIALAASNVFSVLMGPAQDVLIMTGRQVLIPKVMLVSAGIHVLALCLLVPYLGALGAAFASITSGIIANVWLMALAKSEAGIGTTVLAPGRHAHSIHVDTEKP